MQWFANLTLRGKLLAAFSAVLALTAALGGFAVRQLAVVNDQATVIADNWLPALAHAGAMNTAASDVRITQYQHVVATDDAAMQAAEAKLVGQLAAFDRHARAYRALINSSRERELFDGFQPMWRQYLRTWETVREHSRARRQEEANALMLGQAARDFDVARARLSELEALNQRGAREASAHGDAVYAAARRWILVALAAVLTLGLGLALGIARRVAGAVRLVGERAAQLRSACVAGLRDGIEAMARGDLSVGVAATTQPIGSAERDEVGDMARVLDDMIAAVQATVASFSATQDTVRALVGDAQALADSARDGRLDARADAGRYTGAFGTLAGGMNGMLDAVATPLGEARAVLERVAARDLTARMTGEYAGEYRAMRVAIDAAVENLADTLGEVGAASDQVSAAGAQIAGGSQSLAEGASEQASTFEEIAASVQELASMAKQSAENAREASGLAADARGSAAEGAERVQRLAGAMDDIRRASADTARILKTIDEIAFQTNLLALNAAVEAARAGDAGRGFAVVAEEVRALALRSAEAARTTGTLVEEGARSAEQGVAMTGEVLRSLTAINARVERVAEVIAEISAASDQQADGVAQIDGAIEQVNLVTQRVAANAEESASAAEELAGQARTLASQVGAFRLTGQGDTRGPSAAQDASARTRAPRPVRGAPVLPRAAGGARPRRSDAPRLAAAAAAGAASASVAPAGRLIPFDDEEAELAGF